MGERTQAVYVEGPISIGDLAPFNLDGSLSSIKVLSVNNAPFIKNNPPTGPPSPAPVGNGYKGLGTGASFTFAPAVAKAVIHDSDSSVFILIIVILLLTTLVTGCVLALRLRNHLPSDRKLVELP